jgi:uncharacterized protein YjeT (DUF2065 family)
LGVLSPLFILLLFATAFDIGFVRTATHPATIKKLVAESGLYNINLHDTLQQTGTIRTSVGQFSATDPLVVDAANSSFSPAFLKQSANTIIDSIYRWLDGKTPQPDFSIDLSQQKQIFADKLSSDIYSKYTLFNLQRCTSAQLAQQSEQGSSFNILDAQCLPPGTTPESIAAVVKQQLLSNQDFLKDSVINADNLNSFSGCSGSGANCKPSQNQTPFFQTKNAKQIPKKYQWAKKTPLILSVLTVLSGAGIVFLSKTWQKGLRHVGINLVVIGLIMLAFSWAFNRAVSTKAVPRIKVDNAVFQQDIRNLITDLSQQIDKNYWFFGGLYTVVGAGAISTVMFLHRKNRNALERTTAPNKKSSGINV